MTRRQKKEYVYFKKKRYLFLVIMSDSSEYMDILVNIIFLFVGAGIGLLVQSRTQKKAWERDYSIKIVTDVYSKLFGDYNLIIKALEQKSHESLPTDGWKNIKQVGKHFMVKEKFRNRLDNFYERLKKVNDAQHSRRWDILPKIMVEEAKTIFGVETESPPRFKVKWTQNNQEASKEAPLVTSLIHETHPKEIVLRNRSEASFVSMDVDILVAGKKVYHPLDLEDAERYWKSCLQRMRNTENYKFIIIENDSLLGEANKLKKELSQRIEKPWKI